MKTKASGPQTQLPIGNLFNLLKRKGVLFNLVLLIVLLSSCSKENQFDTKASNTSDSPVLSRVPIPMIPGEPILGEELLNPYDINNMENAYAILTGSTIQFSPTHTYIKFLPEDGEDIIRIEAFEEKYGFEFETQPIHFEVLAEGMEDYVDPLVGEGFSPEYGAVTQAHFSGDYFPDVPYVVLNEMYIPIFETRLTFTAFVISGNKQYYDAIDGLCHPDCATWPDCLDDPSLTCQVGPNVGYIPTIDPMSTQPEQNFPGYLLDENLGYHGEIIESSSRIPIIPEDLDCPDGCIPILDIVPMGSPVWDCDCSGDWEDEGDVGGPPSGQLSRCGCFVYDDKRKPGGRISVMDTQFPEPEGVRKIKVMTAPRYFGFVWHATNTDDDGCWKIDKRYNVKNLKIKSVFKDRVSDRMVIRAMRGIRLWNAFLKPAKHKFLEERANKDWHSLCLLLEDAQDNNSRDEQSYVAALTNNSIHEYYDDFTTMPSPGKIKVLLHNWGDNLNAAPMFSEIDQDQFTIVDVNGFLSVFEVSPLDVFLNLWDWSKPDLFLSFGDTDPSDQKRSRVYHEMTHASQYAMAGAVWWEAYVWYIIGVAFTNQPGPYGDGSSPGAGRAELTEGMANAHELVIADRKYGLSHSGSQTFLQLDRFINRAERLTFFEIGDEFIPSGLFFDLFDENGVVPSEVSVPEPNGITDVAKNFPFETQVEVFDLPSMDNIEQFKNFLWQFHGVPSGNLLSDYDQTYLSYGH